MLSVEESVALEIVVEELVVEEFMSEIVWECPCMEHTLSENVTVEDPIPENVWFFPR